MRWTAAIGLVMLSACGGNLPDSESAKAAAATAASRDAAQESRIDNPAALACVQANATNGEWAIIAGQDVNAAAMLQTVLNREGTMRCFNDNNVVVFI